MMQELLKSLTGTNNSTAGSGHSDMLKGLGENMSQLSGKIPGGLVSGAAAGGLLALLMGNKSARKFASKAAGYGGAAVLGGLAFNAYRNWKDQQQGAATQTGTATSGDLIDPPELQHPITELTLIKAMIAAAKADGHLDQQEQMRIHDAVEKMSLSAETRGAIFDLLQREISIEELLDASASMEQKSEVYLASCLVIDIDHPQEREHLSRLANAFELPPGLPEQLENQARLALL